MEKRKIPKWFLRLSVGFCAVFMCLLCVTPASAATGGGTSNPAYYTPIQFDNIIATNQANSTQWWLDWPLNRNYGSGYNYGIEEVLGSNAFGYGASVNTYGTTAANRIYKEWLLGFTHNLSTLRNLRLYSRSQVISMSNLFNCKTYFDFGYDADAYFDWQVSFDLVQYVNDGGFYASEKVHLTNSGEFRPGNSNRFELNSVVRQMINDSGYAGQTIYQVNDFEVIFSGIENQEDNSYWFYYYTEYANGAPYTPNIVIDISSLKTEVTVVESDFPTDWTSWLATAVEGFMNFEFAPGFSIGIIFAAVFGVLVLWFILHLFM